jgi:N-acetylated-alpha-linked acidic dipeptidase
MLLFLTLFCFAVPLVKGCAKEVADVGANHNHTPHRRSVAHFPPQLTAEESIIVNSFDNASIAASSYYYTHGLHVAGTNKSMAQWTADRWAENGFTSRLIEYCKWHFEPVQTK